VLVAILGIVVVVALIAGGVVLWSAYNKTPLPIDDRCVATAGGHTTTITPEQARNAAIIAGMSIKRGLVPRAASIALTTAYQESGIRNLDHGHADSIGLFQQRPSKGWGTIEQIMDPWYSTREFYQAMERIKNWRTRSINDVAQAVQRSAYPDAYRQHEANARALASSLTGETPASFTCVVNAPKPGDPDGMATFLKKTLGSDTITTVVKDGGLTVTAGPLRTWPSPPRPTTAWSRPRSARTAGRIRRAPLRRGRARAPPTRPTPSRSRSVPQRPAESGHFAAGT